MLIVERYAANDAAPLAEKVEADRLSYAEARPEPCSVLQRPAHDTMTGLEAPAVNIQRGPGLF